MVLAELAVKWLVGKVVVNGPANSILQIKGRFDVYIHVTINEKIYQHEAFADALFLLCLVC